MEECPKYEATPDSENRLETVRNLVEVTLRESHNVRIRAHRARRGVHAAVCPITAYHAHALACDESGRRVPAIRSAQWADLPRLCLRCPRRAHLYRESRTKLALAAVGLR